MSQVLHTKLVTEIMGSKVFSPQRENIGSIQNLISCPEKGIVAYVIMCYANFLGKSNRFYAISNKIITLNPNDNNSYILNSDYESLLSAPNLPQDQWPLHSWKLNNADIYALPQNINVL